MVSRNTTLVPSLGLHIGSACEAGLSASMRRERVPPRIRKKEKKNERSRHQHQTLEVVARSEWNFEEVTAELEGESHGGAYLVTPTVNHYWATVDELDPTMNEETKLTMQGCY